jgi:hypothetical protein
LPRLQKIVGTGDTSFTPDFRNKIGQIQTSAPKSAREDTSALTAMDSCGAIPVAFASLSFSLVGTRSI